MKIEYSVRDGIGRITLAHPPTNTLTHPVFADPGELRCFLEVPELKAVIVAGAGRHFCAGADPASVREQMSHPEDLAAMLAAGKEPLALLAFAPVPVLALIRGSCLGAGLEIALACHFRFAAATAMFGFPEAELGLMPGLGGAVLSREIRAGRLADLILSGRLIGAPEATELGLIDRVEPPGEVEGAALGYLRALTGNRSPRLIRAVMEAVHAGRRLPLPEALRRETELFQKVVSGRG